MIGFIIALAIDQLAQGNAAAVQAHIDCVREQVIKFDNSRTDPAKLAKLIQPLCHAEHDAAMHSQEGWSLKPEKNRQEVEFMHTLAAVLLVRSQGQPAN